MKYYLVIQPTQHDKAPDGLLGYAEVNATATLSIEDPFVKPCRNQGRQTKAAAFPNDGKLLPLPLRPSLPSNSSNTAPAPPCCACCCCSIQVPSHFPSLPDDCFSSIFNFSQVQSAASGFEIRRKWTLHYSISFCGFPRYYILFYPLC